MEWNFAIKLLPESNHPLHKLFVTSTVNAKENMVKLRQGQNVLQNVEF
jgi:hypothetical protein